MINCDIFLMEFSSMLAQSGGIQIVRMWNLIEMKNYSHMLQSTEISFFLCPDYAGAGVTRSSAVQFYTWTLTEIKYLDSQKVKNFA